MVGLAGEDGDGDVAEEGEGVVSDPRYLSR